MTHGKSSYTKEAAMCIVLERKSWLAENNIHVITYNDLI